MNKVQQAVELILSGHSCSQAILAAYGPDYGLDHDTAVRLGGGLGGGIGKTGGVCGAANAGSIIVGLALGNTDLTDQERRDMVYEATAHYLECFRARRGSTLCRDIMAKEGHKVPEEWEQVAAQGVFKTLCPEVVRDAAECLEEILPG